MIKQIGTINKLFTQGAIADIVNALPKPSTPVTSLLFPEGKRQQKYSPYVSVEDIKEETGAVPLVLRGGRSIPVDTAENKRTLIEVDPISVSCFASAKDVNDLISLGDTQSIKAFVSENVERLRNRVSQTIEVLCRQAMSGKISYPYQSSNGISGTCDIELGSPVNIAKADISGGTLAQVQRWLENLINEHISKTGTSSNLVILLANNVYNKLVNILTSLQNAPVIWKPDGMVLFGKYDIRSIGFTYQLPGSTKTESVIKDGFARVLSLDYTGKLIFASLDDIDANLAPLPFYAKPIEKKDPDGIKIVGMSKPLPALAISKQTSQEVKIA
ncbi:MAG: major capsid protein [Treponemataceae bacterium]